MKKGIRIFLMIVVVVLVFAGVQWVPNIVNQMQEKKGFRAGCDYERFNIEKEYRNAIIVCRKNGYFVGIAKSALFV